MSLEKNKDLVRRSVTEFWNTGDMSALDRFFAASYVGHGGPHPGTLAQFRESARATFEAFPDMRLTVDDLVAEDDKVTKRWTARGTHKATFMGMPASGKRFEVTGLDIYRVADGKLAECWAVMDTVTMMKQLGALPG